MNLKTYQAYTMAEALAAVRHDLGADAIILNTRSFHRGGILGIGRKTIIEVTATPNRPAASAATERARRQPVSGPVKGSAALAAQAYSPKPPRIAVTGGNNKAPLAGVTTAKSGLGDQQRRQRAERMAMAASAAAKSAQPADSAAGGEQRAHSASRLAVAGGTATSGPQLRDLSAPSTRLDSPRVQLESSGLSTASSGKSLVMTPNVPIAAPVSPAARRFILAAPGNARLSELSQPSSNLDRAKPVVIDLVAGSPIREVKPLTTSAREASAAGVIADRAELSHASTLGPLITPVSRAMQEELAAIKTMVGHVLQRQGQGQHANDASTPAMPPVLFAQYLKLVGHDLCEDLADEVAGSVRAELEDHELDDEATVRRAVLRRLADVIPVAKQPVAESCSDGRPVTIALVGPTGVGKTTTLAKLAASFKLRHGKKVGLITTDTYRIAAVDQLRTYANIIGLPLEVAITPDEVKQAMQRLQECEVVLMDTAGRSQNDANRLDELKQFLAAAQPHEVHLVLSSTAGEKVLLREAEAFGEVGVHKIALTKLDEAVSFGTLVNVIRRIGKPLSFFTTGQEVPDHLEIGRADRLAELVLGGKV